MSTAVDTDSAALTAVLHSAASTLGDVLAGMGAYLASTDQVLVVVGDGALPSMQLLHRSLAVLMLRGTRRGRCADALAAAAVPPGHALVLVTLGRLAGFVALPLVRDMAPRARETARPS